MYTHVINEVRFLRNLIKLNLNLMSLTDWLDPTGIWVYGVQLNSAENFIWPILIYLVIMWLNLWRCQYLSPHSVQWYEDWWIKSWKGFERKRSWSDRGTNPAFAWRHWGNPPKISGYPVSWLRLENVTSQIQAMNVIPTPFSSVSHTKFHRNPFSYLGRAD
jgi:hypothetical protein